MNVVVKRIWRRLRKSLYQRRYRIEHWDNRDNTQTKTDNATDIITKINKVIAQNNQTDAYHKREYHLNIRRYVRERRENRCRKTIEIATLVVVVFYAAVTLYLAITAHRQLVYSERPWVALTPIDILQHISGTQNMQIKASVQNSGKSPALYELAWALLFPAFVTTNDLKPLPIPVPEDCAKAKRVWRDHLDGSIILPGAGTYLNITSEILPQWAVNAVTHDDVPVPSPIPTPLPSHFTYPQTAHPRSLRVALTGCLEYFDEFHVSHRTTFCEIYLPKLAAFGPCDMGNEAD